MKRMYLLGLPLITCLSGCGGSSDDSTTLKEDTLPRLNNITVSMQPLKKVSGVSLNTHIKNGIFMRAHLDTSNGDNVLSHSLAENSDTSKTFSHTNQQEQNVNESDRIKYDGNYLYIAANSQQSLLPNNNQQNPFHFVKIQKKKNNGEVKTINTLMSSSNMSSIQNLYLENNTLVSINASLGGFGIGFLRSSLEDSLSNDVKSNFTIANDNSSFEVRFADISSPEQAQFNQQFQIEGELIDSRVIGDTLYLISHYIPFFSDFDLSAQTNEVKLKNYQALQNTSMDDLLPKIKDLNTGNTQPLFNNNECYISKTATPSDGYDGMMTITQISLNEPSQRSSLCVNTEIAGIYLSEQAIYTHSTHYDKDKINSVIHKFSLDNNQVNYAATGTLDGHFGWRMQNLRFSEYDNVLRVVTTSGDAVNGYNHQLHMLKETDNRLTTIAKLPNQTHPTPIGKVNEELGIVDEDIYAVRFAKNRAFIVTFRQVDPLYVLDLTLPNAPKIAGALEVPGYSSYLHPIGDNLLLGVGQEVDTDEATNIVGSKVSLFEISDITSPTLVNSIVFEGASTPAEYDYHAFSFLQLSDTQYRFALPIETWSSSEDGSLWTRYNQLSAFDIDTNINALSFAGHSKISYNDEVDIPYVNSSDDRAVIDNDDLYYIHGNYVWHSKWQTLSNNTGPH